MFFFSWCSILFLLTLFCFSLELSLMMVLFVIFLETKCVLTSCGWLKSQLFFFIGSCILVCQWYWKVRNNKRENLIYLCIMTILVSLKYLQRALNKSLSKDHSFSFSVFFIAFFSWYVCCRYRYIIGNTPFWYAFCNSVTHIGFNAPCDLWMQEMFFFVMQDSYVFPGIAYMYK